MPSLSEGIFSHSITYICEHGESGAMGIIIQPLSIVTVRFIGEVHDRTGDYSLGFLTFGALVTIAMLFIMKVHLPKVAPAGKQPASSES